MTEELDLLRGWPMVVMSSSEAIISVSFMSLLVQACERLGFSPPMYVCCDVATNDHSVIVELNCEPSAYKVSGGPGETVHDSCEKAARKMLVHLMAIHGLCVYNVNLAKRDKAERSLALFMLKRKYYRNMEKGSPPLNVGSAFPKERIHPDRDCVRADFFSILGIVVERFNIHVTSVEYLQLDLYDHVAWLILNCPGKFCASEIILSDQCASPCAAKQSVAERAIQFLMPIYNFMIEDANFHFLQKATLSFRLEREAYLAIKCRIYDSVQTGEPHSFLDEERPATPRAEMFRIPQGPPPPIPPKKRLSTRCETSTTAAVGFSSRAKFPRNE